MKHEVKNKLSQGGGLLTLLIITSITCCIKFAPKNPSAYSTPIPNQPNKYVNVDYGTPGRLEAIPIKISIYQKNEWFDSPKDTLIKKLYVDYRYARVPNQFTFKWENDNVLYILMKDSLDRESIITVQIDSNKVINDRNL